MFLKINGSGERWFRQKSIMEAPGFDKILNDLKTFMQGQNFTFDQMDAVFSIMDSFYFYGKKPDGDNKGQE
jgi:hypothetical protein